MSNSLFRQVRPEELGPFSTNYTAYMELIVGKAFAPLPERQKIESYLQKHPATSALLWRRPKIHEYRKADL